MDKEFIKEWIKRLRSDEYKQGKNRLRRGDLYCCLGVGCDIDVGKIGEWINPKNTQKRENKYFKIYPPFLGHTESYSVMLPNYLMEKHGIYDIMMTKTNIIFGKEIERQGDVSFMRFLTSLNDWVDKETDKHVFTFKMIADIIEWVFLGDEE